MQKLLTTKEVAKRLDVSERRIRAKLNAGHFPHARRCGCDRKNWLIPERDLSTKSVDKSVVK